MGYPDREENLKRLRKYKENHVNQVIDDYESNPVKVNAPPQNPQKMPSSSPNSANSLTDKPTPAEWEALATLYNMGCP